MPTNSSTWTADVPGGFTIGFYHFTLSPGASCGFGLAGPAGSSAQVLGLRSGDDDPALTVPFTDGVGLGPATGRAVVQLGPTFNGTDPTDGHFARGAGTIILSTATTVTTLAFDLVLDHRTSPSSCRFVGNAVQSS